MIMPAFPRRNAMYEKDGERFMTYEHALDRETANLHNSLKDPYIRKQLESQYESANINVDDLTRLDEQLVAMFDHAVEYLNQYNHNVEMDKMFLSGYSATGTFTDRFAALQPNKIKAYASGGTLDDMILPLNIYKSENLIFPIGTYDYENITGRKFNLQDHNSMARLIYMGKNDDNNTVEPGYLDCYSDYERNMIIRLWGLPVLPRAQALIKLYGESGGKGIFILDGGTGHGMSNDMSGYVVDFLKANRNTLTPVYPIPTNPYQLEYKLYE